MFNYFEKINLKKILFFITIFCLPFYILRFDVNVGLFLIPSTLLEILVIASILITFYEVKKSKQSLKVFRTSFDWLILVLILNAIVAVFFSQDIYGALGILRAYFIEPVLFFYCLVYQIKKSGSSLVIKPLIISGVMLSLIALLQRLTGGFSLVPYEIAQGRVSALYNSANALALFLGPILFLSLYKLILVLRKKPLDRFLLVFYFSSLVLFYLSILWTKSRGGLLAVTFCLGVFFYVLISQKFEKLKKLWFLIPVIFVLGSSVFFVAIQDSYKKLTPDFSLANQTGDTLKIRYYLWQSTTTLLKDHPITGAGLNGFKDMMASQYKVSPYQEIFQYPHNIFLNFWVETGIVGLGIFIAILILAYIRIVHGLSKSKNPLLGMALLAGLTYWVVHGLVDVPYFKNDLSMEFWIVMALIEIWGSKRLEGKG